VHTDSGITVSFIDSASTYEVIAALSFSNPEDCYPWAWQTALVVTDALIDIDHLQLSPSPTPSSGASGSYAVLMDSIRPFVGISRPSDDVVERSLAETRSWARRNAARVQAAVTELGADEQNFQPWLRWVAQNSWLENVQRRGSLIDDRLIPEVARALGVSTRDIRDVARLASDPDEVGIFVLHLDNQPGFDLLWRVYLASALIRGVFHENAARRQGWQSWRHPLRSYVLSARPDSKPFRLPWFDLFLANIIVAAAVSHRHGRREFLMERRISSWVNNVALCRGQVLRRPADDASVERILSAAVDESRRLGIAVPSRFVEQVINVSGGLGLGAIGVLFGHFISPEAGDIAGIVLGGAGYLMDPAQVLIRPERRLREYARLGPGRVDAVLSKA
jgi:hypothetical protein